VDLCALSSGRLGDHPLAAGGYLRQLQLTTITSQSGSLQAGVLLSHDPAVPLAEMFQVSALQALHWLHLQQQGSHRRQTSPRPARLRLQREAVRAARCLTGSEVSDRDWNSATADSTTLE
jgi:hypothetical protein